jgi:hypothetical protein
MFGRDFPGPIVEAPRRIGQNRTELPVFDFECEIGRSPGCHTLKSLQRFRI